jgi:hypothetical protein
MDSLEDYYLLRPNPFDVVTAVDDQDLSGTRAKPQRKKISA